MSTKDHPKDNATDGKANEYAADMEDTVPKRPVRGFVKIEEADGNGGTAGNDTGRKTTDELP